MTDEPTAAVVPAKGFQFGNKLYDRLKFVVQVVLPALGVLYASLAQYWHFANVEGVVGSLAAIALFLGLLLGLSNKNFVPPVPPAVEGQPAGSLIATKTDDGKTLYTLALTTDPDSFADQDHITFNVTRE